MLNKLKSLKNRYEELSALLAQPETMNDQKRYRELAREHAQLSEIVAAYDRYTATVQELADCRAMLSEQHDAEMRELIHANAASSSKSARARAGMKRRFSAPTFFGCTSATRNATALKPNS